MVCGWYVVLFWVCGCLGFGLFVAVALVCGSLGVCYVVGCYFDCLRVVTSLVVI